MEAVDLRGGFAVQGAGSCTLIFAKTCPVNPEHVSCPAHSVIYREVRIFVIYAYIRNIPELASLSLDCAIRPGSVHFLFRHKQP